MRPINKDEAETLRPLLEARDVAMAAAQDAEVALGREVSRVKRACMAPADAVLDDCSMEWVKMERNPQTGETRRIPLKASE